jgi:hypothetical protein
MPSAWVHATIDLTAYGRPYFDLHKKKDDAYRFLGSNHRSVNHEWYQSYGKIWNLSVPFPSSIKEAIEATRNKEGADKAEEKMAWIDHDYFDRVWDNLSDAERKYGEGFFAWVLFNPQILKDWAGVDVLNGKIGRVINNQEIWERCPELKSEYKRLCNYVKAIIKNDKILQNNFNPNVI